MQRWLNCRILLCCVCFLLAGSFAAAQAIRVARPAAVINPELEVKSLSISVSATLVSFQLQSGKTAVGTPAISITTTWGKGNCTVNRTCTLSLYGYFSSATTALSGGAPVSRIPTSEVLGEMTTGLPKTYTAFTQSSTFGGAGASLELFTEAMTARTTGGSRTDPLSLEINLASQPELPAGTYTGTLSLIAESF
jgi:hypothetical protein